MRKKIIANYALDFGGKPCLNSKHWHFGLMCVRKMLLNIRRLLCVFILLNATSAFAASDDAALMQLQQQWAVIKYQISDHAQQKEEITSLMHQAADLAKAHPNKAEPMIWQAIIEATKAGIDSKISRGTFSAAFLIQCLNAMGIRNFNPEIEIDLVLQEPIVVYQSKSNRSKIR